MNTALAITSVYNVLKSDICDTGKVKLIEDFDSVLSLSLIKEAKALAAHLAEEKKAAAAAPTSLTVTCLTPGVDAEKRADVEKLINDRADAKKAKDFASADAIRDKLTAMGVTLKDGKNEVKWELN